MKFQEIPGNPELKNKIRDAIRDGRVPHAWLFQGNEGSGAFAFALATAQRMACTQPQEEACGICSACKGFSKLEYPDLHFLYPQNLTKKQEEHGRMIFLKDFRSMVIKNPFFSLHDWLDILDLGSKQMFISIDDVHELSRKLMLKPFLNGMKFAIIWLPEQMNVQAANKMLKIFEEPPERTQFFLVSENFEALLPTVRSRMQMMHVKRPSEEEMHAYLSRIPEMDPHKAYTISRWVEGNMNAALKMAYGAEGFENLMGIRSWLLLCFDFPLKGTELIDWVDQMSTTGREQQKIFISNAIRVIQSGFVLSVTGKGEEKFNESEIGFLKKFSKFLHSGNIAGINESLNRAYHHIERNAHAKLLFLNLSLEMGGLLKSKP